MSGRSWLDLFPQPDIEMLKRSFFTEITPLPKHTARDLAIGFLHDHAQMIELNPLVLRHGQTTAPKNATPDELEFMKWYEMTDEIQYIPGTSVRSEVTYKGGFYNIPHGLQTHVFAPGGVDIRAKWSVGGNMPGEPREAYELGVDKPSDGLYLREDVDLRCNVFLANFVKRNLKKSHAVLVDRLLKKAEVNSAEKERASMQLDRLGTQSERILPTSRSMQDLSPSSTNSMPLSGTSTPPGPPRRSGTHCTCTGRKHQIACPYYSRLYMPPSLHVSQAPYPTPPRPSSTTGVSPQSWHTTPTDNYPRTAHPAPVMIQQHFAEYGVAAPAATPMSVNFSSSEVLPEVVWSDRSASDDLYTETLTKWTSTGSRSSHADPQTSHVIEGGFEDDEESAKQYYEYQARRTEME